MSQKPFSNKVLSDLCSAYLDTEIDFLRLTQTTDSLLELLSGIIEIKEDAPAHRNNLILPSGKCIGTVWAAMCLNDLVRSKKFVKGLYLGIKAAQQKFPNTRLHLLYAGTGPFASLILPLTQRFSPEEIQFTLLEIQPESFSMVKQTMQALNLEPFIHDIIQVDAAVFKADPAFPVHILLSETMQHALEKEPQVAIAQNLAPQLVHGGIMIPEQIEVSLGLLHPRRFMSNRFITDNTEQEEYTEFEKIFCLNIQTATHYFKSNEFPVTDLEITTEYWPGFSLLCLFTEIRVFGREVIRWKESSLTKHRILLDLEKEAAHPKRLSLQYQQGKSPGFRLRVLA